MLELDEDFDTESRQLCSDGSCVGVIGADGRCKVCGLSADGQSPSVSALADEPAPADGSFEEDRQLCPDGSCTGLIGADGRCKVCGIVASDFR
jgi:hypothetical protein